MVVKDLLNAEGGSSLRLQALAAVNANRAGTAVEATSETSALTDALSAAVAENFPSMHPWCYYSFFFYAGAALIALGVWAFLNTKRKRWSLHFDKLLIPLVALIFAYNCLVMSLGIIVGGWKVYPLTLARLIMFNFIIPSMIFIMIEFALRVKKLRTAKKQMTCLTVNSRFVLWFLNLVMLGWTLFVWSRLIYNDMYTSGDLARSLIKYQIHYLTMPPWRIAPVQEELSVLIPAVVLLLFSFPVSFVMMQYGRSLSTNYTLSWSCLLIAAVIYAVGKVLPVDVAPFVWNFGQLMMIIALMILDHKIWSAESGFAEHKNTLHQVEKQRLNNKRSAAGNVTGDVSQANPFPEREPLLDSEDILEDMENDVLADRVNRHDLQARPPMLQARGPMDGRPKNQHRHM